MVFRVETPVSVFKIRTQPSFCFSGFLLEKSGNCDLRVCHIQPKAVSSHRTPKPTIATSHTIFHHIAQSGVRWLDTALVLARMPAKLHTTVPKAFRTIDFAILCSFTELQLCERCELSVDRRTTTP